MNQTRYAGIARASGWWLALSSAAVFLGSMVAAWLTPDYWEPMPAVLSEVSVGLLATLATYARTRRILLALAAGILAGVATFIAAGAVTLTRWEG